MLQTISHPADLLETAYTPGEQLRLAARQLHGALDRLETALASARAPKPESGTEAALRAELAHTQARHAAVSTKVADISSRLDVLITRLTPLLEE